MSLDTSKFLLVDQMEKARLKLSHLSRRCGDTHGFLTTSQQNVILVFRNDGIVDGTIRLVFLQLLQIDGIEESSGKVGTAGNKERLFSVEPKTIDLLFVCDNFINQISIGGIKQLDDAIVECHQQGLVECGPLDVGRIDSLVANLGKINFDSRDVAQFSFGGTIENHNFGIVFHEGIGNGGKHFGAIGPGHSADGTAMDKGVQTFARFADPQFARGIGTGRQEPSREAIAVQVPDRSLVTVEGPDSFAVFRSPHGGDQIFRGREEQVAIVVELNRRNGTFVSLQ